RADDSIDRLVCRRKLRPAGRDAGRVVPAAHAAAVGACPPGIAGDDYQPDMHGGSVVGCVGLEREQEIIMASGGHRRSVFGTRVSDQDSGDSVTDSAGGVVFVALAKAGDAAARNLGGDGSHSLLLLAVVVARSAWAHARVPRSHNSAGHIIGLVFR